MPLPAPPYNVDPYRFYPVRTTGRPMFSWLAIAVGLLAYALEQLKPMTSSADVGTSLFGQGLLALALMAWSSMWDLRRLTNRASRNTNARSVAPFTEDEEGGPKPWGLPVHDWTTASEPQMGYSLLELDAGPAPSRAAPPPRCLACSLPPLGPPRPLLGSWHSSPAPEQSTIRR